MSSDSTEVTTSQPNTSQVPLSIQRSIMDLLITRLSPGQLQVNHNKLDLLKKSCFSIVLQQDDPQTDNQHSISNSTLMNIIDMSRFQCVKKDGRSQVKLQLELLEMLHDELIRGRQELEDILAQEGGVSLELREVKVHEKILRLQEAAEDFEAVLIPGKFPVRHSLIPLHESNYLSEFQVVIEAKKPVIFNREESRAFCDSVVLHWYVAEQEQHDPDETFEVRYRPTNPADMTEARVFGSVSCSSYNVKINHLMPERTYEFSVKRSDNIGMIYMDWNDTMVLTTTAPRSRTTR